MDRNDSSLVFAASGPESSAAALFVAGGSAIPIVGGFFRGRPGGRPIVADSIESGFVFVFAEQIRHAGCEQERGVQCRKAGRRGNALMTGRIDLNLNLDDDRE